MSGYLKKGDIFHNAYTTGTWFNMTNRNCDMKHFHLDIDLAELVKLAISVSEHIYINISENQNMQNRQQVSKPAVEKQN